MRPSLRRLSAIFAAAVLGLVTFTPARGQAKPQQPTPQQDSHHNQQVNSKLASTDHKTKNSKATQTEQVDSDADDNDRTVLLLGKIGDDSVGPIIEKMRKLDAISHKDITLVINSQGGDTAAMMWLYDTMKDLNSRVGTRCEEMAKSAAAFLLAAGEPGLRTSLPHCQIMFHEGTEEIKLDTVSNVLAQAAEIEREENEYDQLLASFSHHSQAEIHELNRTDAWFTPQKAKAYGLIDLIVEPKHKPPFEAKP